MTRPDPETLICIGAIAGAFGVRGEVRLKSFCVQPEAIAAYGPLFTEDATRSFSIRLVKPVSGGFAARISGISTREEAETLRGISLHAPRDRLPSLPDDEFYHADLIGLEAFDPGGKKLGRVVAVHNHGAGDLLELSVSTMKDPLLLPFTIQTVPTVDLGAGRILVDLPEGLE
ncbi:MAG: ribosome maturation factor RimM [Pseudorhodobacter sp.]